MLIFLFDNKTFTSSPFCGNLAIRQIKFIMKSFFKSKEMELIEASLHLDTYQILSILYKIKLQVIQNLQTFQLWISFIILIIN